MTHSAVLPEHSIHQLGVALLAGLILMATLGLLALVAAGNMISQQRMAANFNDGQEAVQGAAMALSRGESFILGIGADERVADCLNDCFQFPINRVIWPASTLPENPEYEDSAWWQDWATAVNVDPLSGNQLGQSWGFGTDPPRYVIEEVHFDDLPTLTPAAPAAELEGIGYYRVFGRATGRGPAAIAVSEAIIARPWPASGSSESTSRQDPHFCAAFDNWYDCGLLSWRQRR